MSEKDEVTRNYEAFMRRLADLLPTHRGKFALMHDGEIVEFFDTAGDTYRAGRQLFQNQNFSIQEITDSPVDLGFFSYALRHRSV